MLLHLPFRLSNLKGLLFYSKRAKKKNIYQAKNSSDLTCSRPEFAPGQQFELSGQLVSSRSEISSEANAAPGQPMAENGVLKRATMPR